MGNRATRNQKWQQSLTAALAWQEEQPFSSRPAYFGGWVAGVLLDDFATGEQMWRIGHVGNPDEIMMANNLVFALAKQNKVDEATSLFEKIPYSKATAAEQVCLVATRGLLNFRSGCAEDGARAYSASIGLAEKCNLPDLASMARVYLATEEAEAGTPNAAPAIKAAQAHLHNIDPAIRRICEQKLSRLI